MTPITEDSAEFGQNYAILNLDWMGVLLNAIEDSSEGERLINNLIDWNNAVHAKSNRPLTVFTALSFSLGQPELKAKSLFAEFIKDFGTFEDGTPGIGVDNRFKLDEKDIVLRKTRLAATTGNHLEQILKAQDIDTVIISGLSLWGVVLATIYHLFELDYNIFVIADNVSGLPLYQNTNSSDFILQDMFPAMKIRVITLSQALQSLSKS